MRIEAIS